MLSVCFILVHLSLEYCVQFWVAPLLEEEVVLERVQNRFIKTV